MPELVRDVLAARRLEPSSRRAGGARARERWDALQALVALADDLAAARPPGTRRPLAALVAELDERAAAQHAPTVEGVTLASLHAAKGLEWDAVFLVGLIRRAPADLHGRDATRRVEEERRLLYVGITRAREHLELSFAALAHPGRAGRPASARGSSTGPRAVLGEAARAQPAAAGARRCAGKAPSSGSVARAAPAARTPSPRGSARSGRCSTCPRPTTRRSSSAARVAPGDRANGEVPAYVVFTDATLTAIAEQVPPDVASLARITGVGPAKLERYGDAVLALLRDFSASESA